MIPGELFVAAGDIELNAGRPTVTLRVANTGDRPIQVGSHFHFFEVNPALIFERDRALGMRLDIPAGTAVRFEPGDERQVTLVTLVGSRQVYGFNGLVNGSLDQGSLDQGSLDQGSLDQGSRDQGSRDQSGSATQKSGQKDKKTKQKNDGKKKRK